MQTGIISFHGTELLTAKDQATGKIYIAMKPVVEGMGLSWSKQSEKLKNDDRFNYTLKCMVGKDGKEREMLSVEFAVLPAFLYSINPNKVRKDLRDTIIAYQQETFDAINDYWNKGYAVKVDYTQQGLDPLMVMNMFKTSFDAMVETQKQIVELLKTQRPTVQTVVTNNTHKTYVEQVKANSSRSDRVFIDAVVRLLGDAPEGLHKSAILAKLGRTKDDRTANSKLEKFTGIHWTLSLTDGNIRVFQLIQEAQ